MNMQRATETLNIGRWYYMREVDSAPGTAVFAKGVRESHLRCAARRTLILHDFRRRLGRPSP
jgi:hypothetical protein